MGGICEANSSSQGKKQSKEDKIKQSNEQYQKQKLEKQNQQNSKNNLPDLMLDKFKDFPSWEGERYKGEGIKRMRGYICELKNDELVSLRDEFWKYTESLDPQNKKLLKVLRQSTLMEHGI